MLRSHAQRLNLRGKTLSESPWKAVALFVFFGASPLFYLLPLEYRDYYVGQLAGSRAGIHEGPFTLEIRKNNHGGTAGHAFASYCGVLPKGEQSVERCTRFRIDVPIWAAVTNSVESTLDRQPILLSMGEANDDGLKSISITLAGVTFSAVPIDSRNEAANR